MAKSIMIQGTGSNVGKSVLVAGLARAMTLRGLSVMPFKPQNMSNNAAVTADGGEIGRAQALQARAARKDPITDMNPVLLKPESEIGAQVILRGKRHATVRARDYALLKPRLLPEVIDSFERLSRDADIVLVEGAGSPAEINLRAGDIANLGFAAAAKVPVVLAGDIDRGGVIAQIVGTRAVLPPEDSALIKAFVINKFRGDPALFEDGLAAIVDQSRWPSLGVVPWFADAALLPAEDALDIRSAPGGRFRIGVPQLSRIANFDDLDPLKAETDVAVEMIAPGQAIPGDLDLILIPGSKSTTGDLKFLCDQGWDIDIRAHFRRGGHVLGICGGYQMLGHAVHDPDGIEGPAGTVPGLGLLDIETTMIPDKKLTRVVGTAFGGAVPVAGYEIHIGRSAGPDCARPWLTIAGQNAGATSPCGRVRGTYVHGLFGDDAFRAAYLARLGGTSDGNSYDAQVERVLDDLAAHLEAHVDIDGMLAIAQQGI